MEVMVFKGTSIGSISSLAMVTPHILLMEAGEELASFWGLVDKEGIGVSADEPLEPGIDKRDWGVVLVVINKEGIPWQESSPAAGIHVVDLPEWLNHAY